jgi:glucose/arabinose dehydrogenase
VRKNIRLASPAFASALLLASCNGSQVVPSEGGAKDATADVTVDHGSSDASVDKVVIIDAPPPPPPHDGPITFFSQLPGTLCFGAGGAETLVPGGLAAPTLTWLSLPEGFCAHYYAHVVTTRQIRFAPGGELFAASPATGTAGGAPTGLGQIIALADNNGDGYADGDVFPHSDGTPQNLTVFTTVASGSVQGLMFAPGFFYYQDGTQIMKVAYASGQTSLTGTPTVAVDISTANGRYVSSDHWPKTLDIADDGTIYVGNGGDQSQQCNASAFPTPLSQITGGILKIDGTPGGNPVAQGFRNPIAVKCQKGHDLCFSTELALDGSGGSGGREKVVPIRQGDNWGFPCCATTGVAYDDIAGTPNCTGVTADTVALVIGDTPFGIDFETGVWPAPYTNNMLVVLHGEAGSLVGERVVAVPMDSDSGMPVPSSDLGSSTLPPFAGGWDGTMGAHGRPGAVAFATDGRAFIANDWNGDIFWVAPAGLKIP